MNIKKHVVLIFILLTNVFGSEAQQVYHRNDKILPIGKAIEYYIDSTGTTTLDSIASGVHSFKKFDKDVPNMGLIRYPIWLKVGITNKSNTHFLTLEIAQPLLDEIIYYYPDNGNYSVNISGELYPFRSRMVEDHNYVYELSIPTDSTVYYYFRLRTSEKLELPVFLGSKDQIFNGNLSKNILFGIFFGIVIVMFFYNLFIYFTVKDATYLFYVVYILIVGLTQGSIEGYTFQFLWPNNIFLATRSFYLCTALVNITGLEFVRRFLHTRISIPRLDRLCWIIYGVYTIAIILAISGNYYYSYQILQGFAGLVSIYMLVISVVMARKGYRPAKFFIIAWIPLILGIIIYVMKDVGVLSYSTFTNYSITVGSALEVILLSFALADKINILQAETRRSQEQALLASKENERIIREQNVILEAKVNERTLELKKSNEDLANTLTDLQEKETQLVESEKMASLGQLTAGIAHEINNPINFVTSNVNPLRRDVEILVDMVSQMESVCVEESSLTEKQKKIQDLKEDIDFDYLRTEIDYLLKGIGDGASRTAEIVKGLRVFSRLDEDDLKKADINEGLDSTIVIVNHLLNNLVEVKKEYSGIPMVECYPGKLNQVFLNMMSNAIHAIHKRWGEGKGGMLTLSTRNDETHVYVSIKDNGTGMDEATKKKLFEPFFTTKDVGEGTGLGLSIAYNTIRKHNGTIQVNSAIGEGTEFIIAIPINH